MYRVRVDSILREVIGKDPGKVPFPPKPTFPEASELFA